MEKVGWGDKRSNIIKDGKLIRLIKVGKEENQGWKKCKSCGRRFVGYEHEEKCYECRIR